MVNSKNIDGDLACWVKLFWVYRNHTGTLQQTVSIERLNGVVVKGAQREVS